MTYKYTYQCEILTMAQPNLFIWFYIDFIAFFMHSCRIIVQIPFYYTYRIINQMQSDISYYNVKINLKRKNDNFPFLFSMLILTNKLANVFSLNYYIGKNSFNIQYASCFLMQMISSCSIDGGRDVACGRYIHTYIHITLLI